MELILDELLAYYDFICFMILFITCGILYYKLEQREEYAHEMMLLSHQQLNQNKKLDRLEKRLNRAKIPKLRGPGRPKKVK